jgi:hypothetical protein
MYIFQKIITADLELKFLLDFVGRQGEYKANIVAMLHRAYIDDSADRDRRKVVVSGAILGVGDDWAKLIKPWRARLAQEGLDYFKSSECQGLRKKWEKFKAMENGRALADKVRDDFDEIIRNSPVVTLGVVMPVPYHQRLLADPKLGGKVTKNPYHYAFQQVLAECARSMKVLGRNNIVTFAHDDGSDFLQLHEIFKKFKKLNPRLARVMGDFIQLDDKAHVEVQAADVAASVTNKYAIDFQDNPTVENLNRLNHSMWKMVMWGMRQEDVPATPWGGDPGARPTKCEFVEDV